MSKFSVILHYDKFGEDQTHREDWDPSWDTEDKAKILFSMFACMFREMPIPTHIRPMYLVIAQDGVGKIAIVNFGSPYHCDPHDSSIIIDFDIGAEMLVRARNFYALSRIMECAEVLNHIDGNDLKDAYDEFLKNSHKMLEHVVGYVDHLIGSFANEDK